MPMTDTYTHTPPRDAVTMDAAGNLGRIANEAHSAQVQPASEVRYHMVSSVTAREDSPVQALLDRRDDLLDEVDSLGGAWSRPLSLKIDAIEVQLAALGYSTALGLIQGGEDDQ